MSITSILVHAEAAAVCGPRLDCAATLAREFDALLIGLGTDAIRSLGVSDPIGLTEGPWVAPLIDEARNRLDAARSAFLGCAGAQRHEWRAEMALPVPALLGAARAADLIVAGGATSGASDAFQPSDPGGLVLAAGRPVLIVPPEGVWRSARSIVVAWKDTRESRRALSDALPFLQAARDVLILAVGPADQATRLETSVTDVVQALGHHGVLADSKVRIGADDRVSDVIDTEVDLRSADLIVAGGYGRNRVTEWVFGGVTRTLLRHSRTFVLLSH